MQTLQLDEFLRSLKQNIDTPHSLLLGAGASIESGIPSAGDCIWDWKKEIFLSQNPSTVGAYDNPKLENVRRIIQRWLDSQNIYPAENSTEEYSYYAEKAFLIADDRRKYFQHLVANHVPSLGYHLISLLALENFIKSVWTTNFDGMMLKCAHQYSPLVPVEITADTSSRIYRGDIENELLCIALHGDYKYGDLKNTEKELDTQDSELVNALNHELRNRDLIVIGYSGRDQSLMQALTHVYSTRGAGKLFWCGYGSQATAPVEQLIDFANKSGRTAFYIPTEGFDSTMYAIARHCMGNNKQFLSKIDEIKKKLSAIVEPKPHNFSLVNTTINKIVATNAFPIVFPKQCFQFEVQYETGEKPWDFCKKLYQQDVMAIPYNNMVYAWGSKEIIEDSCRSKLKTNIELCPLSKEAVASIGALQELLLKTVTRVLAESNSLGYSKDKIWDSREVLRYKVGNKVVAAYSGVNLSLVFDARNTYLTFAPSYMYADDDKLTKDEKKIFADCFYSQINNGRPNKNTNAYIMKWVRKLIGNSNFSATYPRGTTSAFLFSIGSRSALIGINNGSSFIANLPQGLPSKRIVFHGREYRDPNLIFYNTSTLRLEEDFHPMRGLINNAPIDYAMNSGVLRSSISVGVLCPSGYERQFSDFIAGLNRRSTARHNPDFLISYPGFFDAFKTGIDLPSPGSNRWHPISATNSPNLHAAAIAFGDMIAHNIDQLSAMAVDVILVYIPKEYELLTSYSDQATKFDLHDYVKAYAAQKRVATQFVREKTIESDLHCQIMWSISLALYVKSGRIPWTITGMQPDTAFAGIGYSVMDGPKGNNIVVGCSHIYSSDGQGMKYRLSKIQDYKLDRKKNPFLSENEAYRLGLNIKDLFHASFSEFPKRVVIHKRTPFRKEEIKGLVESLSSAGIKSIELVEITYEDDLKCFALTSTHTDVDGFPVRRGMCFPAKGNTMYLYTHGIAPSVVAPNRKYIQGGKSIPLPLKVTRHYGTSDMSQIASEILGLSKMNWNSFNLYSKLPCTIESSNEIARIGWLLSQYEGTLYDYRYFM